MHPTGRFSEYFPVVKRESPSITYFFASDLLPLSRGTFRRLPRRIVLGCSGTGDLTICLIVTLLLAAPAAAQFAEVGSLDFPTSARSEEAQRHFLRGVAILHSFGWKQAIEQFQAAQAIEPDFALAYGYENGAANLTGSSKHQRVFAYVNRKGILAVGSIVDGQAFSGNTVFSTDREFHVKVEWKTIVSNDKGVTNMEVRQNCDYSLPVRNVFCGMSRHDVADWIADELQRRAGGC